MLVVVAAIVVRDLPLSQYASRRDTFMFLLCVHSLLYSFKIYTLIPDSCDVWSAIRFLFAIIGFSVEQVCPHSMDYFTFKNYFSIFIIIQL